MKLSSDFTGKRRKSLEILRSDKILKFWFEMQEVAGDDEKHLKVLAFAIGSDKKKVSTCLPLDYSPSRINQG